MSLQFNINLRVDPIRGDDNNNDGSLTLPLKTLNEAFRRCESGWRMTCRISLAPGTYDLGTNPTINVPSGAGIGAEPLLIMGEMEESILGSRVVGPGSTRGSGANFGTVADSGRGLTVDAWRGYTIEFTSGSSALAGRRYLIASNTTSTFTVVDSMAAVPAAGDVFVVKRPAASIVWTGNLEISGTLLGLANLRFDGPGGAVYTSITQLDTLISNVWFTGIGSGALRIGPGASLKMIGSTPGLFSTFQALGGGGYFQSANPGAAVALQSPAIVSISRSVWSGVAVKALQNSFFQCLGGVAFGAAHHRAQNNSILALARFRFSGVSAAPVEYGVGGATVLAVSNAVAYLEDVDMSGCAADPIAGYDGAVIDLLNVSGTGNVGAGSVGVRLRRGTIARNLLGNSVTAMLGDVKVGTLPAVSSWAAVASQTTDQAASPSEFCQIGP